MQLRQFVAHTDAEFRIEVRQRLVEQKDLRLPHDGAADRDPLPLPARQLLSAAAAESASSRSIRAASATRASISLRGVRKFSSPKAMFCSTVMCGYSA